MTFGFASSDRPCENAIVNPEISLSMPSPDKAAKELAGIFAVIEPPKVWNEWQAIDVNVLRVHQFEQARASMRATETALLYATPRRLRDAVRVQYFIDH